MVGLAVARSLARAGREVLVLEASSAVGSVTSSRNSGVIHAGIYYEAGSLKARSCVHGRRELYRFCEEHGVAHRHSVLWHILQVKGVFTQRYLIK